MMALLESAKERFLGILYSIPVDLDDDHYAEPALEGHPLRYASRRVYRHLAFRLLLACSPLLPTHLLSHTSSTHLAGCPPMR